MKKGKLDSRPSIKDSQPTRYSPTTASELRSVTLFWGMIDHDHIKGKPEAMDKNPNDDGVFEFTTSDGTPIGKFAVQIKTLQKRDYRQPKYQCKLGFLSFCYHTNLPVILLAVDQQKCEIHWRYMDMPTLDEAQDRIEGKSVMISFPEGNVIAAGKNDYVADWQTIVEQDVLLRRNADKRARAHDVLEVAYKTLRDQLAPPDMLGTEEIAAFQRYLDQINFILDHQFPVLKARAYPDYWKMSVAVADMAMGERSHFLIPVAYGSSELPVRQLEINSEEDMMDVFHGMGATVLIAGTTDSILHIADHRAYNVVKSDLLRAYKKAPLFVPDQALANEYLAGFVNSFYAMLGLDQMDEPLALKELQYLLTAVLPISYENRLAHIADGATDLSYGIDGERDKLPKPYFKERIMAAKKLITSGYLPKYRTDVNSQLFHMGLVYQYIHLLMEAGQTEVKRVYSTDPMQRTHVALHIGIRNLELVKVNLHSFFNRFLETYEQYINTNFSEIKGDIDFFEGSSLMVFVLQTIGHAAEKPYLECYRIHDEGIGKRRILFFIDRDADNPMDRKRWLIDRDPTCVIYCQTFVITSVTNMVLDFLFERSPTYSFIGKQVLLRLEPYLDKKARGKRKTEML